MPSTDPETGKNMLHFHPDYVDEKEILDAHRAAEKKHESADKENPFASHPFEKNKK